jgi:hypothetical protein
VKGCESQNTLREETFQPMKLKCHGGNESLHGGVGGASEMRRFMGTTAVDRIPNTRTLQVSSHVDIVAMVN